MTTRTFATIFGVVFLGIGAAGFVPFLVHSPEGGAIANMEHGMLFDMFPVNPLHNIVHILFGLWGLAASRSLSSSTIYARGVAIIYAVLTVMGLVPGLDEGFGLVPLYGNDIWLHAGLAVVGAYFGWVHRNPATG
jgi:Domain of unknown function (DUF4383)